MSYQVEYRSFGSLLKNVVDNRGRSCPVEDQGIPLIATNCINNNQLYPVFEKIRYVSDDTYKNWFRSHPKPGDMVFVLKGTPGRVAWVPYPVNFCIAQDMVAIRADEKQIYPKYLFATLRSKMIQQEIEGLHVGTLIPHFKKGDFDDLKLPIVDNDLQKFIGDIYFNISLKIDLLHRQNITLEAMAETLFRQWFVEEAQEYWDEYNLSDFADHLKINMSPGKSPSDVFNHYSIPAYDEGIRPSKETGSQILSNKYKVISWTILVSKLNPKFPRIWPIGELVGDNNVCSTEFQIFKPKQKNLYGYIYFLLCSNDVKEEFIMAASGTSGSHQRVRPEDILNIRTNLPSIELAEQYSVLVMPIIKKTMANITQIRTLEKLRDTLLPKLMSGEVGVAT